MATGKKDTVGKIKTDEEKKILVPGRGFGNFIINKTRVDYFKSHAEEVITYEESGFWFEFDSDGILVLIGTTSSTITTREGVRVGDTAALVLMKYGEPERIEYEKDIIPAEYPDFENYFDYILLYKDILFYINEEAVEGIALFSDIFFITSTCLETGLEI